MSAKRDPASQSWSRASPVEYMFKSADKIERTLAGEYKTAFRSDQQHPVVLATNHFWRQNHDMALVHWNTNLV